LIVNERNEKEKRNSPPIDPWPAHEENIRRCSKIHKYKYIRTYAAERAGSSHRVETHGGRGQGRAAAGVLHSAAAKPLKGFLNNALIASSP
jgi:hypothetical protein